MNETEWLTVAVDLLVRVMKPRGGRGHDRDDLFERHHALALVDFDQDPAQILAVDVLHREEELAALFADVVNLDDVLVMQRGCEPRLVDEHLDEPLIARLLRPNSFDHHVMFESGNAVGPREQYLRHSTGGEVANDLVPAELGRHRAQSLSHDRRSSIEPPPPSSNPGLGCARNCV